MPNTTPEQIGREAATSIADAIADGLENILLKLADNIARLSAEQNKQRDEIKALSNRIEAQAQWIRATRDKLETMFPSTADE